MDYRENSIEYLKDIIDQYRKCKQLAERAVAQVNDEDFFKTIDSEVNSIALLMKHIAGNMFSRWTNFLTSDGEKPNRHRDTEFIIETKNSRQQLIEFWEAGWKVTFDTLESLAPEDLGKTIYIRQQPHSVIRAMNRQLGHYSYHVGQIVFLAKFLVGKNWKTLSIAKGQSEAFNREMLKKR